MSVFGTTVSGPDVERRVLATLQYWLETYLRNRELETDRDLESVARPGSWRQVNQFDDKNVEDSTPFIAVISDGLAGPPRQEGDGTFLATWNIGVGIIVEAATGEAAMALVKDVYLPVLRKIILQRQSLRDWTDEDAEPWATGIEWIDESYDDVVSGDAQRSIFSGQLMFEVTVSGVEARYGGPVAPADPDTQPGSDWPTPLSGDVTFVEQV